MNVFMMVVSTCHHYPFERDIADQPLPVVV